MSKERIAIFYEDGIVTSVLSSMYEDPVVEIVCIDKDADDHDANKSYMDYLLENGFHEVEARDISWHQCVQKLERIAAIDNIDHVRVTLMDNRQLDVIIIGQPNGDVTFFYTDNELAIYLKRHMPELEDQILTLIRM